MKKVLVIIFVIANMSLIESPKRYWQGVTAFRNLPTATTDRVVWAIIIEADTKNEAKRKFNTVIKEEPYIKGLQQTLYDVYEITKESILK